MTPSSDEAPFSTLLARATSHAGHPLVTGKADRTPDEPQARPPRVPEQRTDPDVQDWPRIRTDAGDQRWLNRMSESHCWELY